MSNDRDHLVTISFERRWVGDQAVYEALQLLSEVPGVTIEGWKP